METGKDVFNGLTQDQVVDLAKRMQARATDPNLEDGSGLETVTLCSDKGEPLLAVIPYDLYDVLVRVLGVNPGSVDPREQSEHLDLGQHHLAMLRAFFKLELGFCDDDGGGDNDDVDDDQLQIQAESPF